MTIRATKPPLRRRQFVVASHLRTSALCVIVTFAVVACRELVDPPLPSGAEPFEAPAVFQLWWKMTEACAKHTASLADVSWYVVPGTRTIDDGGQIVSGYWSAASNRIVLAETAAQVGSVVRHEMLHAILRGGGHPRQAFLNDCGGVVSCGDDCLRDAGPAPRAPPGAVAVPSESLEVSVVVTPVTPTTALYGGYFTLTVLAKNPSARPVVVTPAQGADGEAIAFRFDVAATGREIFHDEPVRDASVMQFAPGETKRHVFDLVVGGAGQVWALEPGTHRVEGAYGRHWSSPIALDVSP
jgi:hypothetical protein